MTRHQALTRSLAVLGTALVITPILAPLAFGMAALAQGRGFLVDYLMPFEVYPVTLLGTALIAWAAARAHERTRAVGIAIATMLAGFVLAMASARLTGIADSPMRLEAWRFAVTAGFLVVAAIAQLVVGAEGALLARGLRGPGGGSREHLAGV